MNTLTLDKAAELYEVLGSYIPEVEDSIDAIKFIGKIVNIELNVIINKKTIKIKRIDFLPNFFIFLPFILMNLFGIFHKIILLSFIIPI